MKDLKNLINSEKAKLLHDLFPQEVPPLLEFIDAWNHKLEIEQEAIRKDWNFGLMSFDQWFRLSRETADLLKRHRSNMIRSSRVFSDQLFFSYTALYVTDCIIKYADWESNSPKFKLAVALLFKPENECRYEKASQTS